MKKLLTMFVGIMLAGMITPPLVLAQDADYEVKGVVVDKAGMPILGATVIEKGTTNGVSTGIDGDYAIRVASPQSVDRGQLCGLQDGIAGSLVDAARPSDP